MLLIDACDVSGSSKPVQTEATSTNSPLVAAEDGVAAASEQQVSMPPLAPLAVDSTNADQTVSVNGSLTLFYCLLVFFVHLGHATDVTRIRDGRCCLLR